MAVDTAIETTTGADIANTSGPNVGSWLTDRLRALGIRELTDVQVRALRAGIADGRSMIVSAPTSSGKTLVGEIAVLTALRADVRAIYLVSHKALADQKYLDFLSRFGELATEPIASVGLNTGDRAEGDIGAQLMVATYEKALGLILTGQLQPTNALIVADELQILGEPGRGPEIEALCAVLRQRGIKQFVALTATVENPEELAGWMNCELVRSYHRDVPLHQGGLGMGPHTSNDLRPGRRTRDPVGNWLGWRCGWCCAAPVGHRERARARFHRKPARGRHLRGIIWAEPPQGRHGHCACRATRSLFRADRVVRTTPGKCRAARDFPYGGSLAARAPSYRGRIR